MDEGIRDYQQIPVADNSRKRTDLFCTVFTSIFAGLLFIISIAVLNTNNLAKMTFPADGEGNLCGWDVPDYPLLYYSSFADPVKRLCVRECPRAGDKELSCYATKSLSCSKNDNPKYEVQIYDSISQNDRIGLFCWPTEDTKKQLLLEKSGLKSKHQFLAFYDAMWNSLWISVLFGIVYIILLQCFPRKVVPWSITFGGIFFIILAILIFVIPSNFLVLRIIIGAIILFIGFLCCFSIINKELRKAVKICSHLAECASLVLKHDYKLLLFIPIFIVLFVGLIFLIAFQLLAVWSMEPLTFNPEYPFYSPGGFGAVFFTIFIFIQLIWGMSFLKESFNFCISGYATNWYYHMENEPEKLNLLRSPKLLLKYHWGSVVGASLMLGFFYFFDFFLDFFCSNDRDISKKNVERQPFHKDIVDYPEDGQVSNKTIAFCNLVRSEAMGYINIIPIPFCNASRYCQYLAEESSFYDRSQTVNRVFRLGSHAVLVFIVTVISIGTMKGKGEISVMGVVFIMVISLFTVTYFICFHGDILEGLLISIFVEEKLTDSSELYQPPQKVKEVYNNDRDGKFDTNNSICDVLF